MVKAKTLAIMTHLGRHYAAGETIELDDATAIQLLAAGVIVKETPPVVQAVKPVAPAPLAKGREA